MTAHTPGPWEVQALAPNIALQIVGSHGVIAALPTLNNEPRAEANARLIAAAPLLLDYFRASKSLQSTLGAEGATGADEIAAEAAYEAATKAVKAAIPQWWKA